MSGVSEYILQQSVAGTDALDVANLYNIKGRVGVVTGGGTGLGLITAMALAENGVRVYITGRRLEPLQAAEKFTPYNGGAGKIVAIQGDVSSKEGIIAIRDAVAAKEKYINILVNNAGVWKPKPEIGSVAQTAQAISDVILADDTFDTWRSIYDVNVTALHFTSAAFLPLLAAAKDVGGAREAGNIVNVSSVAGLASYSLGGQFGYNSSKAAVLHLTQMYATELANRGLGIRVNAIVPGHYPSGMNVPDFKDRQGDEKYWREVYKVPFGRVGNAVDYSQALISLVVNEYASGANIVVDGAALLHHGL